MNFLFLHGALKFWRNTHLKKEIWSSRLNSAFKTPLILFCQQFFQRWLLWYIMYILYHSETGLFTSCVLKDRHLLQHVLDLQKACWQIHFSFTSWYLFFLNDCSPLQKPNNFEFQSAELPSTKKHLLLFPPKITFIPLGFSQFSLHSTCSGSMPQTFV